MSKSVKQIMSMDIKDIEQLPLKELKEIVGVMASAGNKRIDRLTDQDIPSQALSNLSGGRFSVAGKDKTQLINEFRREVTFMSAKTSSVSGAKQVNKETIETLKEQGIIDSDRELTPQEMKDYWQIMDRLRDTNPALFVNQCLLYGDDVYREIADGEKSKDEIFNEIQEKINEDYESAQSFQQQTKTDFESVTGWDIY